MNARPLRSLITVAINVLVVVAILLTVRVIVRYFGVLSESDLGTIVIRASDLFVLPLGIEDVRSPYAGVFDGNATITVGVVLLLEWVLSVVRDRI